MGRKPIRLTEEQRNTACSALSLGLTRSMAARIADCHPATLRAEIRRDSIFAGRVDQCETKLESLCMKTLREASSETKHWRAAAWTLERLYPNRYAKRGSDTVTFEQARHVMMQVYEIVSAELPVKKFRQRIFDRLSVITMRLDREPKTRKQKNNVITVESRDAGVALGIPAPEHSRVQDALASEQPDTNETTES
jgi:hypothetical protein